MHEEGCPSPLCCHQCQLKIEELTNKNTSPVFMKLLRRSSHSILEIVTSFSYCNIAFKKLDFFYLVYR